MDLGKQGPLQVLVFSKNPFQSFAYITVRVQYTYLNQLSYHVSGSVEYLYLCMYLSTFILVGTLMGTST